jgi:protein associated with RNAse G/E
VLIRKKGYYIYTNLASPFIFEDNTIKFIDYDLDIKYYPGMTIHVVDIDEHKKNSIRYKYEDSIIKKVDETKTKLLKMIANEEFIYSKEFTKKNFKKLVSDNQYKKTLSL